jgi:hypothetical protein
MQQNTASPTANSLGISGTCSTRSAASGDSKRMNTIPYSHAPHDCSARRASCAAPPRSVSSAVSFARGVEGGR